jgi:hypothetical protein
MKKIVDIAVLLFCVIVFATCSNDESVSTIQGSPESAALFNESEYSQEFADLNVQLQIFDQKFMSEQPANLRGWRDFLTVTSADILGAGAGAGVVAGGKVGGLIGGIAGGPAGAGTGATAGAIVGGIICGAAASLAVSQVLTTIPTTGNESPSIINEGMYQVPVSSDLSGVDSIGYYHNKIIENILTQYPNIYAESQDFIFQQVVNKVKAYGFSISDNEIAALKAESKAINQIVVSSPDDLFVKFRIRYPESVESINVIEKYIDNLSKLSTDEQVLNYTTGFRDVVTASSIPASSAALIKGSVAVGMSSNALWVVQ